MARASFDYGNKNFLKTHPPTYIESDLRAELDATIAELPAGSMGETQYDPSDKLTWHLSDDPKMRAMAKEFYGYDESTARDGLSIREKNILYAASEPEIQQRSDPKWQRQQEREAAEFEKEASSLWGPFVLRHPEIAQNKDAVARAIRNLVANSGLSRADLTNLARSDQRTELLDRIADEARMDIPSGSEPRHFASVTDWADDNDHRTAVSGGSGSTAGGQKQRQEAIIEKISDIMKPWGGR